VVQFPAKSGLLYGEEWTKMDGGKWPTLFYHLHYMTVDDYMQASISPSGDVDYFYFYAPVTGSYTMYSIGTSDPYAALFGPSQNYLWDDDDSGDNLNFSITYNLTGGNYYYLKVMHSTGGTGNYNILISHP
jgi:hypothetical protein